MNKIIKLHIVIIAIIAVLLVGFNCLDNYVRQQNQERYEQSLRNVAYLRGEIVHVAEMTEGGILLYVDVPGLNTSGELQEFWITEESFVGEELMKELENRKPGALVEIFCYSTPREGLVHGHSVRPVIDINYYEE